MATDPANPARALLLMALVAGGVASGRVLERGGIVRVSREARGREWHLFVFVPRGADRARMQSLARAIPGERYSILDEQGYLGEAEVVGVERVDGANPSCPGEHYFQADVRWRMAERRNAEGWMLGVGP